MTQLSVRQLKSVYETKDLRLTHTQLDPGEEIPWHRHSQVADTFYVLRGPLTIETGGSGESVVLETGKMTSVCAGVAHRVCNEGREMVEFLLIQDGGEYDFQPR